MSRLLRRALAVLGFLGLLLGAGAAVPSAQAASPPSVGSSRLSADDLLWQLTPTGSSERFRGLSAVSRKVAWVSGTGGTVLRTTDGGATWSSVGPPGTSALQFRDIEATSAQHAVILSIGEGTDSRIYVTDNGGASWTLAFQNDDPRAFYDCMAFTSNLRGFALSDPVDGKFRLLETRDGGHAWSLVDPAGMPPALEGEFAFAASGTCLTAGQGQTLYLASGGIADPRVFRSTDRGQTWAVTSVPEVVGAAAAGIFSVRFRDRHNGIAVGGDFTKPDDGTDTAAWSDDGGTTWHAADVTPAGYRSGSAWVTHERDVAVAVGPTGSDVTTDAGRTWTTFDTGSFDSVECARDGSCWASGEHGRVAKLVVSR
ncbi:MAG TPA: oxidoreductase [Lapillicoccus sp.]|jgi:photosystem II stability/assembly factor-like uncharacterized protein|nr:oxidoreductase [Lapillicoccus sp.]